MASQPEPSPGVISFFRGSRLLGTARHDGTAPICESAEDSDVEIPTNCTSGTCGTCMVTLLSGSVPLPDELPPGLDEYLVEHCARLACIGIPEGDVEIEILPPL